MKLYKQVMAKYYPKGRVTDGLNLYGVATAEAFVELLYGAGKNPTRASLMKAFRNWNQANPFLLPGVKQRTGVTDQFPIKCEQLVKFTDGTFKPVSGDEVLDLGHLARTRSSRSIDGAGIAGPVVVLGAGSTLPR